jgi:hypothetical protein
MRNLNRSVDLSRIIKETKELHALLQRTIQQHPSADPVRLPFHSAFRAEVGQPLTEEQKSIKIWRDRLAERNEQLRSYLIFYNRAELLGLLPLVGFGAVINFGYPITAEASLGYLSKELDTLRREQEETATSAAPALTPWGPIMAILRDVNDADLLLAVASGSGLIAPKLTGADAHSHKTRVRALLEWLAKVYDESDEEIRRRLAVNFSRELLRRRSTVEDQLRESLGAIGWQFLDGDIVPLEVLSPEDLASLPVASHHDLLKAAKRFSYDPSGAVGAACGAVDGLTESIYALHSLGHPGEHSFQQRVKQSIKALKIIDEMQAELVALGWEESKSKEFAKNLEGSLSQTAKVLESLRSHMGDAHGTKPVVDAMVINSIRWASVLCSFLAKPT